MVYANGSRQHRYPAVATGCNYYMKSSVYKRHRCVSIRK